jgi:phosphoribosylanthranilate isomerase
MAATRIKICGITRPDDARAAVDNGADAIGFVFHDKSPRFVNISQAAAITAVIPPFVSIVALFVNEQSSVIRSALDRLPIDLIQFHGDESEEFCGQFGRSWIKAIRVKPGLDIAVECTRYPSARAVLLDTWKEGVPGGTGTAFDWRLATGKLPLPVILAGGLNAGNVGTAINALQPAAVDVSGGVESGPGIKDARRIQQFTAAVRTADRQVYGVTNGN